MTKLLKNWSYVSLITSAVNLSTKRIENLAQNILNILGY